MGRFCKAMDMNKLEQLNVEQVSSMNLEMLDNIFVIVSEEISLVRNYYCRYLYVSFKITILYVIYFGIHKDNSYRQCTCDKKQADKAKLTEFIISTGY